jgi:histone deacetylase complex regulatory component SIN3
MQETVSLIQQLFMNHPELNDGFQVFVPSEFRKPHSKSASYPTTLAPIGEEDESMAAGNPWAEESDRSYEQLAVDYVHRVQVTSMPHPVASR